MRSIFFFFFVKEGKFNVCDLTLIEITEITFSISCKKFKIFPFILFEKTSGSTAYAGPKLQTLPYFDQFLASHEGSFLIHNCRFRLHKLTSKAYLLCVKFQRNLKNFQSHKSLLPHSIAVNLNSKYYSMLVD